MAVNVAMSSGSASVTAAASSSAVRALALELKSLQEDPLEGIRSRLVNEDNLFEWEVALFGPPDTLYQGGYFKVRQNKFFRSISKNMYVSTFEALMYRKHFISV